MSTWTRGDAVVTCQRCAQAILPGEVYRLVTAGRYPFCAACVERFHGLQAPTDLAQLTPSTLTDGFERLKRFAPRTDAPGPNLGERE